MFTVYILSCADASFHVGITKSLNERIDYYLRNKLSPLKSKMPFEVVYQVDIAEIIEALAFKDYLIELSDKALENYIKEEISAQFLQNPIQNTTFKAEKVVLPTSYLGNIAYFSSIEMTSELCIDIYDRYEKQTYRNRCTILSANGLLNLSVPVTRPNGKNTLVKDVLINNEEDWRKNHIKAIESAYRSAPFYDFYADELFQILKVNHTCLIDLNIELTQFICRSLGLKIDIKKGTEGDSASIPSKIALLPKERENFKGEPYQQVFLKPSEFEANLSVIDLLFNCGKKY